MKSYRESMNILIGPILNYFGFFINNDGIIQKYGSDVSITLSGKHIYVPLDGEDFFKTRDSTLLIPFNPFKIREHILILSKFICSTLSNYYRDEDDEIEYNELGEVIEIVTLVKRAPTNEDALPATFNGVIYEIWCRNEEVLGKGIDFDGNDIKAIYMTMIDCLTKAYHGGVNPNIKIDKLLRIIDTIENIKEEQAEIARSQFSSNLGGIDLVEDPLDSTEFDDDSEVEEDLTNEAIDTSENDEEVSKEFKDRFLSDGVYDEMEF